MPELPEVETVRRGLQPVLEGARITAVRLGRADLRLPFPPGFARRLAGCRIDALGRRAKYLLADLDSGEVLVMHLGMSGSFRIEAEAVGIFHHPRNRDPAHDHVVFELASGARVTYNDPRRFGLMTLVPRAELESHRLFAGLGPEPLGNAFSAATLAEAARNRTTSLKALLLDQHVIAGLGNIYVCEALHRAGLSPLNAAATLATASGAPNAAATRLAGAVREVLTEAIAAGGSSIADHARPDGSLGYFQHAFRVYDREGEPCPRPRCRGIVRREVQAGRSTFFCPACQRPSR
ncbi:bifunctional DNA-formamidopyrimidine glycosylase/DNA-(apurinic or apyrimidinic site) lyase [Blastochloris sulfoviridis]|uniref:Formamidopyrimidine-DNA glycosylase n=1 Tax=Blastochloris sulfoviridis TaxID=50712 RepID=A0A5M6I1X0_9HYPH|nr:bifunctional DNA-formamidopyrimidine glycosylase/DNA-(apurinic or apyrimidinic site) lyase [Blastochloris sulfoviridis]KAA5601867.1 bifunctional DNA-formamidopyrimidine glycosylase/DNA-(apurinic or apyrimidinic site) lyase [Blastochloris sulfoviridis]